LVGVAANTLLAARGGSLGRSSIETGYLAGARTLAEQLGPRLKAQVDVLGAESPRASTPSVFGASDLPGSHLALDIGPETLALLEQEIARAGLVMWCGVPGLYREETFAQGTRAVTEMLARAEAFTAVLGDDTVGAARSVARDASRQIDYLADGGEAALALLRDIKLPGLLALRGLGT
jgi:phosphoglycerate kinase